MLQILFFQFQNPQKQGHNFSCKCKWETQTQSTDGETLKTKFWLTGNSVSHVIEVGALIIREKSKTVASMHGLIMLQLPHT